MSSASTKHVRRRRHVRRSSIGGLESYQRIRHGAHARSGNGAYGPRLPPVYHGHLLRHSRSGFGEAYNRDPRGTAKKAEAYLKASRIGDTVFVGPEAEFFVFDDVKYKADPYNTGVQARQLRTSLQRRHDYETGNLGHRPRVKGGYFPVPPVDSQPGHALPNMLTVLSEMGVTVEKHHHEVAAAQHEARRQVRCPRAQRRQDADLQICRAPGSPMPMARPRPSCRSRSSADNGSGMHVHLSIWKDGKLPLPATNMRAFPNPASISSWHHQACQGPERASPTRRRTPTSASSRVMKHRFCLPIRPRNRWPPAASLRTQPEAKRVEVRFPDPTANPYSPLPHADAGSTASRHKLHPARPWTRTSTDCRRGTEEDPDVCGSLREALESLDKDRKFLTAGAFSTMTRSTPSSN